VGKPPLASAMTSAETRPVTVSPAATRHAAFKVEATSAAGSTAAGACGV